MLPVQDEMPQNYQHYTITTKCSNFEGMNVIQFGIEQISFDGFGNAIKTVIEDITDDKTVITGLLNHVIGEDLPAESLYDVVSDYIAEVSIVV